MTLGERVKDQRLRMGLQQAELAALAGMTQATISRIEADKLEPQLKSLRKLIEALHVSPEWLIGGYLTKSRHLP